MRWLHSLFPELLYGHGYAGSLHVSKLKDLYNAEQQILKALPKMVKAAGHPRAETGLRDASPADRDARAALGADLRGSRRDAQGQEVRRHGRGHQRREQLIAEKPDHNVLDTRVDLQGAARGALQGMAGYGSVRAWAEKLGHDRHAQLLQQTLDEERATDQLLTQLADRTINIDAARHDEEQEEEDDSEAPARRASGRKTSGRSRSSNDRPSARWFLGALTEGGHSQGCPPFASYGHHIRTPGYRGMASGSGGAGRGGLASLGTGTT